MLRREKILAAAATLGDRDGFEAVQTTEIAREAGVAIATLYRYFPTKPQLYAAVLDSELRSFAADWEDMATAGTPLEDVAEHLEYLTERLAARPKLAAAMVQSASAGYVGASVGEVSMQQMPLRDRILRALGVVDPTVEDQSRVKLLQYAWWGVLFSVVDSKLPLAEGKREIRTAVRLILTDCDCWRTDRRTSDAVGAGREL
ncbi:TetR/AcrR family transcriptional regulator [Gordonia sp. NPDC127522]|uniref:TetR/AcrR family transcriptional regulator n=1 Tax=Gordonia sp. NPDC127522 TaxID=3345390 RepID=UPI003642DC0B